MSLHTVISPPAGAALPDVCLVLEGTYPYVSGGVSTWVHQIITALPELTFSVLFIGSERNPSAKFKYELPKNLVGLYETYLFDPKAAAAEKAEELPEEKVDPVLTALWDVVQPGQTEPEVERMTRLLRAVQEFSRHYSFLSFWKHPATFQFITTLCEEHFPTESFLDFYWTCRFLIEPAWRLTADIAHLPPAHVVHSLCTGYAGLSSAFIHQQQGMSCLLSEHGIYVKERIAEIQRSRWIHETVTLRPGLFQPPAPLRRLWIEFFKLLGRYTYDSSNRITSLFTKNAETQVQFGADPGKIDIIPNGVQAEHFLPIRQKWEQLKEESPNRCVVGFLGRVVSIKDVKTLLKAAALVHTQRPDVRFLLAGPTDEDPRYFAECEEIVVRQSLGEIVHFPGPMKLADFLPKVDMVVLSSISEGLPFSVLEAFGASLPMVTTDVGSCRELLEGRPGENPPLGIGGLVVPVGDAERLADAILHLANDPAEAARMGACGHQRTITHYIQDDVVSQFRELYQRLGAKA